MSRYGLSVLLTTALVAAASQTTPRAVADLIEDDEIESAESLLRELPSSGDRLALEGEIAFRRGQFDEARRLYSAALSADSRNARAHYGLGRLLFAKLKTKDAVRRFSRAVQLAPGEARYRLGLAEALSVEKEYAKQREQLEEYLRLKPRNPDRVEEARATLKLIDYFGNEQVGVVEVPDAPKPIPFRKSLNLIFTKVLINGRGPYEFAIDTGASQTVLSEKLASELALAPITTTLIHGVGGSGKVESKIFRIQDLEMGDVRVKNLPVGTFSDPLLTQLADGIVGTAMLSDFWITVDYPSSQMRLSRTPLSGGTPQPAWYFNNLLLTAATVNAKHSGHFVVDTGAVTSVLSHRVAARLGIDENTPGARLDLGLTGVGGLQGSVLRVPNAEISAGPAKEEFEQLVAIDTKGLSKLVGTEVSGVLGFDFLENYKLVLDYKNVEIRLMR